MIEFYGLYFQEHMETALDEMKKYLGEDSELFQEAVDKSNIYKENYYLRDNLQITYVSKVLAKRRNRDELILFISKFMDEHSYQLSTPGPIHMFTFGDNETNFLYDMFGLSADEIFGMYNKMVEETFYGKISKFFTGWVKNAPHKLLITAMLIESLQKEYEDIVECCEYLWAFCEYPIIYRKSWSTGVKEDVMIYTIEHLGNKFKVKKVNNLQGLLKYDAHSSVSYMKDK